MLPELLSTDRQQTQDARHHGRKGPEGQLCRRRVEEQAWRVDVEVSRCARFSNGLGRRHEGVHYVNGVEIDADSRTTATVNRSGLRLTLWKQDSFQRELHEVLSRQQFHFRRANHHRTRPTATTCTATQTARESAGALTFPSSLPGWERHTGGSRSTPTVHPCGLRSGGCGWLSPPTLHEPKRQPPREGKVPHKHKKIIKK